MIRRTRLITVCDACFRASCWHGVFMCQDSRMAGTVPKTARELRKLNAEHPDYFSKREVERQCGGSDYSPTPALGFRDGGNWSRVDLTLPDEGALVEIKVRACDEDVGIARRLGSSWFVRRSAGPDYVMGEPSRPEFWRPLGFRDGGR